MQREVQMEQGNYINPYNNNVLPAVFPNPFHSPYVDPVGSIVGLRVLFIDGKLCYVPVEPHVNYMINEQFGGGPMQIACKVIRSKWLQVDTEQKKAFDEKKHNRLPGPPPGHPYAPPNYPFVQTLRMRGMPEGSLSTPSSGSGPNMMNSPKRGPPPQAPNPEYQRSPPPQQRRVRHSPPENREPPPDPRQKPKNEMDDPPWIRSHPQPLNGKRGTAGWKGNDTPVASATYYNRQQQPPPPPPPQRYERAPKLAIINRQEEFYDPWGRGGGGAPIKDSMGNIVTDRRKLGMSWSKSLDTNETHHLEKDRHGNPYLFTKNEYVYKSVTDRQTNYSAPISHNYAYDSPHSDYGNSRSMAMSTSLPALNQNNQNHRQPNHQLSAAEQHRLDLEMQIEDNRRRKQQERQAELDEERREMRRLEIHNERIRREEEEERRKERERAAAIERRRMASMAAEEQLTRARGGGGGGRRQRTPPPQFENTRQRSRNEDNNDEGGRQLEWWERKPAWGDDDRNSAVIPALRGKPPRTPSADAPSTNRSRMSRASYRASESIRDHHASRAASRQSARSESRAAMSRRMSGPSHEPPSYEQRRKAMAFTIDA